MQFDLLTGGIGLQQTAKLAPAAERAGFTGLVVAEAGRTAYLSAAVAATTAADLDLLTGVAVAFPRSPMITAATAWELAEASGGRFRLGLGTQVRAHIERRYDAPFDPPGPRLREYVLALRAIFRSFRGDEPLAFEGEHYQFSLLPPMWSPGPLSVADPPIDVAAVNPWMLRMAGEVADGVHVHPLNHPAYLRETVLPNLAAGAATVGRDPGELEVIVPCFVVTGDDQEERTRWREMARAQVAFYGSTPNYAFIFEQLGRGDTTPRLRERQKVGDLGGMTELIDDELLSSFVVEGPWESLAEQILARYAGLATRVVNYFGGMAASADLATLDRWAGVAEVLVNDRTGRAG